MVLKHVRNCCFFGTKRRKPSRVRVKMAEENLSLLCRLLKYRALAIFEKKALGRVEPASIMNWNRTSCVSGH